MSGSRRLAEPLRLLESLIEEARARGVGNPSAMALATSGLDGEPAVRMVLLRGLDERGLVFYTSYASAKARELERCKRAAAVFYWEPLGRQVRVVGDVERIARDESEAYFAERPRGHRIAAWASRQSAPLERPEELFERVASLEQRFAEAEVPLPPFWGGYRLDPERIEHWRSSENRLHERVLYERASGGAWETRRLQP